MTQALRRYAPIALAGVHAALQYRATIVLSAVTAATGTALQVFLWRAVYAHTSTPPGLALTSLTTYVVLAQVLALLHANKVDDVVAGEVYRGDIAVSLLRPANYVLTCLVTNLPAAVVTAALAGGPVLLAFALLTPLRTPTLANVLLFSVAAALSVLLAFEVNLLVGLAAFVSTNTWGIRMIKNAGVAFLAGQIVPLSLLPQDVARVIRLLPFQGLIDGPLRLLLGTYRSAAEAGGILAVQAVWVLVLLGVTALAWRGALRRIEVVGG
ncbi:ABC-2 family transporter protein [Micromonospora sp. M61]|uniref:ABC transporter permease n=1 Tax=Micromonospora sp. M61 TaxID=2824890 RepID=UPI001B38C478|nr:ABC-2 family transporter protein [Micromonospora sp. M61]MBQ0977936.1 ABC-2 family transporter protein [Micromonospora sp. M61]